MKINLPHPIQVVICCPILFVATIWIQPVYGESKPNSDTIVTVGMNDEPMENLFSKIERQTNLKFVYAIPVVSQYSHVSLPLKKRSVNETLDEAFEKTVLTYEQRESEIFISARIDEGEKDNEITISGTIRDFYGVPLTNTNIVIEGTSHGTSSDINGKYRIAVTEGATLCFSFVGYKTIKVKVGSNATIDVALLPDMGALDTVVVNAGYWQVKKKEETGNISRISHEEIAGQPVANLLSAMQGRVPGIYIKQQTGITGGNFKINIHGTNSIRAQGNEPLYIIDGVPFISNSLSNIETSGELYVGASPLMGLNPNDIKSIEILKDADATAIYGSRGANGVILISTTEKQLINHPDRTFSHIDVSFYQGISKVTTLPELLPTKDYLTMRSEAFTNDGKEPQDSDYDINGTWNQSSNRNWLKLLIGNEAYIRDAYVSIAEQKSLTSFRLSSGYHQETLPFPGRNVDWRVSHHIDFQNISLNQKLRTDFTINYSVNSSDFIKRDLTEIGGILAPNAPAPYDKNGILNWENSTWDNPYRYLNTSFEAFTNTFITNMQVSYNFFEGLSAKWNIGYTNIQRDASTLTPKSFYKPTERDDKEHQSIFTDAGFHNWIVEPQLSWTGTIGNGNLEVLVGGSALDQTEKQQLTTASGFPNETVMKDLGSADETETSGSTTNYRYVAAFGRINYKFNHKFLFNITGRRDGSSRFGPGKQFANFGAIGMAWIFSNEGFIQSSLPFLSFGKIRASYGTTGNDQIGDYEYLATYGPSRQYGDIKGFVPQRLGNADFAWESTRKLELGIKTGFLQDRIDFSITYFHNSSNNQLIGYPLPSVAGFNSIQGNYPAQIRNKGWEIEVGANLRNTSVLWNTFFNITIPNNELIAFPNLEDTEYANKLVIGKSLDIQKTYHYLGVDPSTGLYKIEDVNNDGFYTDPDKVIPSFLGQKFFGGLDNRIQYKGIELAILFQFVKQTGRSYQFRQNMPGLFLNQEKEVLNRWQKEGDITNVQKFGVESDKTYELFRESNASIVDASFLRLKNVSLSYNLPRQLIEKMKMQNARLFLRAQNLFTWTRYKGLDPEWGENLPPMKVVAAGAHITF